MYVGVRRKEENTYMEKTKKKRGRKGRVTGGKEVVARRKRKRALWTWEWERSHSSYESPMFETCKRESSSPLPSPPIFIRRQSFSRSLPVIFFCLCASVVLFHVPVTLSSFLIFVPSDHHRDAIRIFPREMTRDTIRVWRNRSRSKRTREKRIHRRQKSTWSRNY